MLVNDQQMYTTKGRWHLVRITFGLVATGFGPEEVIFGITGIGTDQDLDMSG